MSASLVTATIRKCGSQWCLYTKDGSRVLGKHETKEKAMAQERAIKARQATGAIVALLDGIAQALERRRSFLASAVDATTEDVLEQRNQVLEETGFDDIMQRDEDVAQTIYDTHYEPIDQYQGYTHY